MWRTGPGFSAGSAADTSRNQGSCRTEFAGEGAAIELECVRNQVLARGEEDEIAGGARDTGEGYRSVVGAGGSYVEVGVAGVAALESGASLEELAVVGLRCGHAGDVKEFEFADVVPGKDGLFACDFIEEIDASGNACGLGEAGLRVVEAARRDANSEIRHSWPMRAMPCSRRSSSTDARARRSRATRW